MAPPAAHGRPFGDALGPFTGFARALRAPFAHPALVEQAGSLCPR